MREGIRKTIEALSRISTEQALGCSHPCPPPDRLEVVKVIHDLEALLFPLAFRRERPDMADEALHTLIGTSANLSLDRLHTVASEAALKLKMSDSPDKIQAIVDMVSEAYNEACIAVRKYLESAD